MAIYKLFPTKDATLYTAFKHMNTGLDSIIETTTDYFASRAGVEDGISSSTPQSSRILIQFDLSEINNVITNIAGGASTTSFLRLYSANARGLSSDTTLVVNAVGQNWNMGTGEYLTDPISTNGCGWNARLRKNNGSWETDPSALGFDPTKGITGSYKTNEGTVQGGGAWYTASQSPFMNISQSFDFYSSLDLNVDVTKIINKWKSNEFTNYGFIVRQSGSQEFLTALTSVEDQPRTELKFFSRDTNTIYPPQLEIKWDDSIWSTGSSTTVELTTNEALITLPNNKNEYYPEEIAKFRINAIERYPARTYLTASSYTSNFYLPSASSLYAIKDSKTNDYVIDFDNQFTKISADEESSFFKVYMNGLEPERYYTILVQTNIDGETKIFDQDLNFKVIEG